MPLVHDLDLVTPKRQFEQRHHLAGHELRGDSPAAQTRELLLDEADVLGRLNDADPILSPLGLHRNDVVTTVLVETDAEFVDLDLARSFDRRPKMVLKAAGGQPEEDVDQPRICNQCMLRETDTCLTISEPGRLFRYSDYLMNLRYRTEPKFVVRSILRCGLSVMHNLPRPCFRVRRRRH